MKKQMLWLPLLAIFTVGCLDIQVRQTVFLEADGGIEWQLQVREFYEQNSADGPGEAMAKVQEIEGGEHPVAEAMWSLGAKAVTTQVTRSQPMMEYVVSGEFESITPVLLANFDVKTPFWTETLGADYCRISLPPEVDWQGLRIDKDLFPIELVTTSGEICGPNQKKNGESGRSYLIESVVDLHGLTFRW